ncbi:hypothetical protein NQ317_018470 [Molorchus minor]|uniref:Uncharacterized protein n=1 Tax=Molorchus minor TaxID=1323400 RepID=A0ABQ9ISW2_9CUCU|nr:hypothetical protein NQ317_018470 [Molorchus minor]
MPEYKTTQGKLDVRNCNIHRDFCEPRRRRQAAIFVPGTNGIAELPFGPLTDGDTDADWQKVAIFVK